MKHQNPKADKKSAAQTLTVAIFAVIFALTLPSCSTETKTVETSRASTNISSPVSTPAVTTSTSGDLAGTYAVDGAGADGKSYQGEMIITKRDAVYQMTWKIGADSYDGVAVQSGNTVAAAYTTGDDGKGCGAIIYDINADNSLDGKWGEWGVNSSGTEKAVPAGTVTDGVGTLDVTGTNADGSPYKGKLTVTKGANDVYQFAWATGSKFIGTGIRMGKYLAAGSGAKQCGFVIYEVKGDMLDGKWGIPGSTALGTEKATKK